MGGRKIQNFFLSTFFTLLSSAATKHAIKKINANGKAAVDLNSVAAVAMQNDQLRLESIRQRASMQLASVRGNNGENVTYIKYREEELREYLLSHAETGAFYTTYLDDSSSGLINYFDSSGRAWRLMEDDDEMVADSVEFLISQGAPLFNNIGAAQEFESNWGANF